jgi:hypothetical protein
MIPSLSTHSSNRVVTFILVSITLSLGTAGCELIASVDRSRIPVDSGVESDAEPDGTVLSDGSIILDSSSEGSMAIDSAKPDGSPGDAGSSDALVDSATDTSSDTSTDASTDTSTDGSTPVDGANVDSSPDADG